MLTVTQAAKETGLSRVAIYKAIKQGRLSATQNPSGQTRIDAAELFRVYNPVNKNDNQINSSLPGTDNQLPPINNQLIAQQLEFTRQMLRQVENERDNLRQSLNQAMAMLTHQPAAPTPPPQQAKPEDSPLWRKLFGKRN